MKQRTGAAAPRDREDSYPDDCGRRVAIDILYGAARLHDVEREGKDEERMAGDHDKNYTTIHPSLPEAETTRRGSSTLRVELLRKSEK